MGSCCRKQSPHVKSFDHVDPTREAAGEENSDTNRLAWEQRNPNYEALFPFCDKPVEPNDAVRHLIALRSSRIFEDGRIVLPAPADSARVAPNLALAIDCVLRPTLQALKNSRAQEEEGEGTKAVCELSAAIQAMSTVVEDGDSMYSVLVREGVMGDDGTASKLLTTAASKGLRVLEWLGAACVGLPVNPSIMTPPLQLKPGQDSPTLFYVDAINEIFSIAFPGICQPSAGMEGLAEVSHRWAQFQQLLAILGIVDEVDESAEDLYRGIPFVTLNGHSKTMLLYLDTLLLGQHRLPLSPVDRQNVLACTLEQLKLCELWPLQNMRSSHHGVQPRFFKMFPFFHLEGGDSDKAVERGEGHGPRKEFFDLAAEELMQEWGPVRDAPGTVAHVTVNESVVIIAGCATNSAFLTLGTKAVLRCQGQEAFSGVITDISRPSRKSLDALDSLEGQLSSSNTNLATFSFRLAAIATFTGKAIFAYQLAKVPLFKRTSDYCWFNPAIPHFAEGGGGSPATENSSTDQSAHRHYRETFALAGWLAAQAITNGVSLPVPLPVAFFKYLLYDSETFTPSDADILELDSSMGRTIERIKQMNDVEFQAMLELEEADKNMSKDRWIKEKMSEIFNAEGVSQQMGWFRSAFHSTGILRSIVYHTLFPEDLQTVVVGRPDDGLSDFNLATEFRIVADSEFSRYPHNKLFLDTLVTDVLDKRFAQNDPIHRGVGGGVSLKRAFLKFLTGRVKLPPHKGEEVIRFELPYTTMSVHEHDAIIDRLPQSHTCDNTLELPNYCEALLFGSASEWFQAEANCDDPKRCIITHTIRENVMNGWTANQTEALRKRLGDHIYTKLVIAVTHANSYDLDEIISGNASGNGGGGGGGGGVRVSQGWGPIITTSHTSLSIDDVPVLGD
eukprot:NODE_30_length_3033_cov_260.696716_g26_i0.p1 GENE.NODE_30_length_3033_cov_260.696716_g26_i0~~NODE_30_length_3033_cov_260.696716_g26_i0.p1  ORF type:complete len:901 (+),score=200.60 NODE_30_length_3033_cov_260.696716_g26_i0:163-2865(+)